MPAWRSPSFAKRAGTVASVNSAGSTSAISFQAIGVETVPAGTVSTPIAWNEIADVEPAEFTLATVPARFAKLGDLHAGIDDVHHRLDTLLEWADRDGAEVSDPDDDATS